MEVIQSLNLITASQYLLAVFVIAGVTQAIKQTKLPNGLMPLVAGACGAIIGAGAVLAGGGGNYAAGVMIGIGAGLTAAGAYSGASGIVTVTAEAKAAKSAAADAEAAKQESEIQDRIDAAVTAALAKREQADTADAGKETNTDGD
jgi:hypothetical protein